VEGGPRLQDKNMLMADSTQPPKNRLHENRYATVVLRLLFDDGRWPHVNFIDELGSQSSSLAWLWLARSF